MPVATQPGYPWWMAADIHTVLTYIKVAASDISDTDTIKFIKTDSAGRIEIITLTSASFTEIVDQSNKGTGTYTYYLDIGSYRKTGLQFDVTPGSASVFNMKIYATLQDDSTAAASCVYHDYTRELSGQDNITNDYLMSDYQGKLATAKYIKITIDITNASNDSDFNILARSIL